MPIRTAFTASMAAIGGFETAPMLTVAVSGGADSMALLLLAHEWAKRRGGRAVALTVDHGLRKESKAEAMQVHKWCAMHGIEHHALTWKPPEKVAQASAREARYELLTGWCRQHHALHLLLAHHRDDQAETLMFRLARGSAIDGLAGMAAVSCHNGVRLLRPLLACPKRQLEHFLRGGDQPWIEDPSNQNPRYTRTLIRQHMSEELSEKAARIASRFAVIRNHMENKTASHLAKTFFIYPQGYGELLRDEFLSLDAGHAMRALSSIVQTIGGEHYPPRTEKLERLYKELTAGRVTASRTFSGCIFHYLPKRNRFLVRREPKAIEPPMPLAKGQIMRWDRRFQVNYGGRGAPDELTARALGSDGLKIIKSLSPNLLNGNIPKAVLATLPSLWRLEELLLAPHIDYTAQSARTLQFRARFFPAKALAGWAFSSMNRTIPVIEEEFPIRA
jgi:tRNA(Ile)-lysidine synthase